jgi:hypothetical protein
MAASLLDFLGQGQSGGGLLGSFGGQPQSDAEKQRTAAMWRDAMLGAGGPANRQDPFNFVLPGMTAQPGQPQSQPQSQPSMPPPQMANAPPAMPPPQNVPASSGLPPGAMPVSMPMNTPAAAAPPTAAPAAAAPSFMGGLNNYIDNNRATLMALAGGLASGGIGQGFSQAAKAQELNRATWGVIGHDIAGNPQMGWINPQNQTIKVPGGETGVGSGMMGTIGFPKDAQGNPLQGQALLAHLKKTDPTAAAMVEAIVRGDAGVSGSRNLQKYMPIAELVDPTLKQYNYDTRKATALDFTSKGKSGLNIKALETVGGHINNMADAYDKVGNTSIPFINAIKNAASTAMGGGAPGAFETYATGVANELGAVFRSYGMSDSEIKSWRDRITTSASPEQFRSNMSALVDMLKTRREVIAEQYRNGGLGELPPQTFAKLDASIARLEGKLKMPGGPQQAPAQAAPGQASVVRWEKGPDGRPRPMMQQ